MIMCIPLPAFMYLYYNIDLPYGNRGEKCNKKLMCVLHSNIRQPTLTGQYQTNSFKGKMSE